MAADWRIAYRRLEGLLFNEHDTGRRMGASSNITVGGRSGELEPTSPERDHAIFG